MSENVLDMYQKRMDKEVIEFTQRTSDRMESIVYKSLLQQEEQRIFTKYDKKLVDAWLERPQKFERELNGLHLYLMQQSFFYRRLLSHFCNLLTFDFIITPKTENLNKVSKKTYLEEQEKVFSYLEKLNVKDTFSRIASTIIAEGGGYYFCRDLGHTIDLQEIPSRYCTIVDKNELGYVYAINLELFNGREELLENYDKKIKDAYIYYKNKEPNKPYYVFSNRIAPVFKFDESTSVIVPTFIALYYDIFDMFDLKKMLKDKMLLDNWQLLFQKIPMNEGKGSTPEQFLIPLKTASRFHNNIKDKLPRGMSVITSPMEVEAIKTERTDSENGMLNYPEKSFWESSGTSGLLFGADRSGSAGLKASIQVDENFVIPIYRQIERWINAKLRYVSSEVKFTIVFPDLTQFNKKEKQDSFLKMAQYGYPKELVSCAMGITPMELHGMLQGERFNEVVEKLNPLQSSHTASQKQSNAVVKEESDLAPSTIVNRDNETNQNKKEKV